MRPNDAERRLSLLVDCPTCGCPPMELCRSISGRPLHWYSGHVHGRRVEAMRVLRRVARALGSTNDEEGRE